jgi:hypothetical protein
MPIPSPAPGRGVGGCEQMSLTAWIPRFLGWNGYLLSGDGDSVPQKREVQDGLLNMFRLHDADIAGGLESEIACDALKPGQRLVEAHRSERFRVYREFVWS